MASTRMCECGHSEGLHNFRDFVDAEPCGMPGCDCDAYTENEEAGWDDPNVAFLWDAAEPDDEEDS